MEVQRTCGLRKLQKRAKARARYLSDLVALINRTIAPEKREFTAGHGTRRTNFARPKRRAPSPPAETARILPRIPPRRNQLRPLFFSPAFLLLDAQLKRRSPGRAIFTERVVPPVAKIFPRASSLSFRPGRFSGSASGRRRTTERTTARSTGSDGTKLYICTQRDCHYYYARGGEA